MVVLQYTVRKAAEAGRRGGSQTILQRRTHLAGSQQLESFSSCAWVVLNDMGQIKNIDTVRHQQLDDGILVLLEREIEVVQAGDHTRRGRQNEREALSGHRCQSGKWGRQSLP